MRGAFCTYLGKISSTFSCFKSFDTGNFIVVGPMRVGATVQIEDNITQILPRFKLSAKISKKLSVHKTMYVIFFFFIFRTRQTTFTDFEHRITYRFVQGRMEIQRNGIEHRPKTSTESFSDKISGFFFFCNSSQSSLKFRNSFFFIRVASFPASYNKHVPFETGEHKSSKFLDAFSMHSNSCTRLVEFFTRFGTGRGMCKRSPTRSKQRSQKWERWSWENATGSPSVILLGLPNSCIHRFCKECLLVAQASKLPRCWLTASLLPHLIPSRPRSEPPSSSTRTSMDFPSEIIEWMIRIGWLNFYRKNRICFLKNRLRYVQLILEQLLF